MTNLPTCPMQPRLHKIALSLALLGLWATSTHAQVLVTDTAAISTTEEGFKSQLAQTLAQYSRQGLQYAKQLDQYYQEVEQYKQLLMTVKGLGANISLTSNKLETIKDPSELIDQNCPGTSGGSVVGTLVTSFASTLTLNKPITESQQQICANIVTLQVDEYNRTVAILDQLVQYGGTLQKLNKLANEVSTLGTATGATTQAANFSAITAQAMHDWQTAVAGDEAVIKALSEQQRILGKVALRGSNTVLGTVVQAAALKTAFEVN